MEEKHKDFELTLGRLTHRQKVSIQIFIEAELEVLVDFIDRVRIFVSFPAKKSRTESVFSRVQSAPDLTQEVQKAKNPVLERANKFYPESLDGEVPCALVW